MDTQENESSVSEERRPADFDYSAYTESTANIMRAVDRIPDDYRAKWDEFIDLLNEAVEHVFGEPDDEGNGGASIVIGVQWGDMGKADSGLPVCVGSSNMPVCHALGAAEDLADFVAAQHEDMHRQAGHVPPAVPLLGEDGPLLAPVNLEDVPPEVRQAAENLAARLGFGLDSVRFVETANVDDLNDLPETDEPERPSAEG